jgi:hypothetical protein
MRGAASGVLRWLSCVAHDASREFVLKLKFGALFGFFIRGSLAFGACFGFFVCGGLASPRLSA